MKIIIYKGKLSEVIEMMRKDREHEAKENKDMVNDKEH